MCVRACACVSARVCVRVFEMTSGSLGNHPVGGGIVDWNDLLGTQGSLVFTGHGPTEELAAAKDRSSSNNSKCAKR